MKMINPITILFILFGFLFPLGALAVSDTQGNKIQIVATTPDLADLAKAVGGEHVEVFSLSRGDQDPHWVDPRPSMITRVRKADLLLLVGMDLDTWVRALTDSAGNKNILYGSLGYVDCSVGLSPLQVPTGKVDGATGDIHIYGNPHYTLDPHSAQWITQNILKGLIGVSPSKKDIFQKNRETYLLMLDQKIIEWKKMLSRIKNRKILTYHDSWRYFANCFDFEIVGNVEMKPGIPPSPVHLLKLIHRVRTQAVAAIFLSDFHSPSPAEYLHRQTGVRLITLPQSSGGRVGSDTYVQFFDELVKQLLAELGEKEA